MTCANGASVKSGISPTSQILVDRSLWETVTGTPSSWFDWLLDIFVPQTITASDLCALNLADPTLPSVSLLAAAFFRDPSSILQVFNYVRDKLRYSAFAAACVCNGASSPCYSIFARPIPTLPDSAPNGSVVYDLGMKFHCITACAVTAFGYNSIFTSGSASCDFKLWDLTAASLLWTQTLTIPNSSAHEVTCSTVTTLIAGHDYAITFRFGSGWTALVENAGFAGITNADISSDRRIDNWSSGTGPPSREFSGLAVPIQPIVCPPSGPPTAPVVDSQPTDLPVPPAWTCTTIGDVCVRLLQLSQKLDWIIRALPTVTSSSVAEATIHSGLTGSGTLSVSGILGLRIELTTIPSQYGGTFGSPVRHYGAGRVSMQTAEGWLQDSILYDSPMEVLNLPPTVTTVGYTLAAGVVAKITELVKGP